MKKRIIAALCAVLFVICVALVLKSVLPSKGADYKITESQIEKRISINKISNLINQDYLAKTFTGKDYEEHVAEVEYPTDRDGVIKELKEAKVIEEILISEDKLTTYEEAKKSMNAQFEQLKTDPIQQFLYSSTQKVLKENDMSEEEYLNLCYDLVCDMYNRSAFETWFIKSEHYKDNRDPNLKYANEYFDAEEQVEAFLEKELKKVKFVIK